MNFGPRFRGLGDGAGPRQLSPKTGSNTKPASPSAPPTSSVASRRHSSVIGTSSTSPRPQTATAALSYLERITKPISNRPNSPSSSSPKSASLPQRRSLSGAFSYPSAASLSSPTANSIIPTHPSFHRPENDAIIQQHVLSSSDASSPLSPSSSLLSPSSSSSSSIPRHQLRFSLPSSLLPAPRPSVIEDTIPNDPISLPEFSVNSNITLRRKSRKNFDIEQEDIIIDEQQQAAEQLEQLEMQQQRQEEVGLGAEGNNNNHREVDELTLLASNLSHSRSSGGGDGMSHEEFVLFLEEEERKRTHAIYVLEALLLMDQCEKKRHEQKQEIIIKVKRRSQFDSFDSEVLRQMELERKEREALIAKKEKEMRKATENRLKRLKEAHEALMMKKAQVLEKITEIKISENLQQAERQRQLEALMADEMERQREEKKRLELLLEEEIAARFEDKKRIVVEAEQVLEETKRMVVEREKEVQVKESSLMYLNQREEKIQKYVDSLHSASENAGLDKPAIQELLALPPVATAPVPSSPSSSSSSASSSSSSVAVMQMTLLKKEAQIDRERALIDEDVERLQNKRRVLEEEIRSFEERKKELEQETAKVDEYLKHLTSLNQERALQLEEEKQRLEKELKTVLDVEITAIERTLQNEKKKIADGEAQCSTLEVSIEQLKKGSQDAEGRAKEMLAAREAEIVAIEAKTVAAQEAEAKHRQDISTLKSVEMVEIQREMAEIEQWIHQEERERTELEESVAGVPIRFYTSFLPGSLTEQSEGYLLESQLEIGRSVVTEEMLTAHKSQMEEMEQTYNKWLEFRMGLSKLSKDGHSKMNTKAGETPESLKQQLDNEIAAKDAEFDKLVAQVASVQVSLLAGEKRTKAIQETIDMLREQSDKLESIITSAAAASADSNTPSSSSSSSSSLPAVLSSQWAELFTQLVAAARLEPAVTASATGLKKKFSH